MRITDLRRAPELPGEYFALYEELEQRVRGLPLVARPHNIAILHAALAFEVMAHHLRALGEREIYARRALGLPVSVTTFSLVMHGCHRGLTQLLQRSGTRTFPLSYPPSRSKRLRTTPARLCAPSTASSSSSRL